MKRILGVTILLAGAAVPALAADWSHVGSLTFGRRFDHRTEFMNAGAPVEGLRLVAGGPLECASIAMTTADGDRQTLFSGVLSPERSRIVEVPSGADVQSLTFDCRSLDQPAALLDVSAESPTVAILREQPAPAEHHRWVPLGHAVFGPVTILVRHITEGIGRNVQAVGFEPVGGDAYCTRATAYYENGDVRALNIAEQDILREGVLYRIDLPGERNVREVDIECRAVDEGRVTINLYGNRDILPTAG